MTLMTIEHVSVQSQKKHILTDINWSVPDFKGIIGIIGPNGAGKTTLIHSIIGLRPISGGHIKKKSGLRIAYCPDVPSFDPYLTVTEVLQQIYQLETGGSLSVERSQQILQWVNLAEAGDKQTRFLSRGMLQRLAIGTVVVSEPDIAIFDEPTSALDIEGQVEIMQLLQHFSEKCPVLLSSHNLYDIQQYAKEIIVINKGKLVFNGKTSDFQKGNSGQFAFSSDDEHYMSHLATNLLQAGIVIHHDHNKVLIDHKDINVGLKQLPAVSETTHEIKISRTLNTLEESFLEKVREGEEQ